MPAVRSSPELSNLKLKVQSNVLKKNASKPMAVYGKSQGAIDGKRWRLDVLLYPIDIHVDVDAQKIWYPTTDVDRNEFRTTSGKVGDAMPHSLFLPANYSLEIDTP